MPVSVKESKQLRVQMEWVRLAWVSACKHDGIDPASKFVVFSADNPFRATHEQQTRELIQLRNRIAKNIARRERHAAYRDLGLKRVKGALGGTYYE